MSGITMIAVETSTATGLLLLVVGICATVLFYFLPSLIARSRHHHNTGSIFVLNLFLGWTFIGWVVALVMAVSNVAPTRIVDDR